MKEIAKTVVKKTKQERIERQRDRSIIIRDTQAISPMGTNVEDCTTPVSQGRARYDVSCTTKAGVEVYNRRLGPGEAK
jgi:hypothetical protein